MIVRTMLQAEPHRRSPKNALPVHLYRKYCMALMKLNVASSNQKMMTLTNTNSVPETVQPNLFIDGNSDFRESMRRKVMIQCSEIIRKHGYIVFIKISKKRKHFSKNFKFKTFNGHLIFKILTGFIFKPKNNEQKQYTE